MRLQIETLETIKQLLIDEADRLKDNYDPSNIESETYMIRINDALDEVTHLINHVNP